MINKPTLSCCLTAYNEQNLIHRQLQAISDGWNLPSELILLNDGSTDDTSKVMKNFVDSYPGKTILVSNQYPSGPPSAFNQAAKLATGDWLYLASANDTLTENAFLHWQNVTANYPQPVLIVADVGWSDKVEVFDKEEVLKPIKEINGIEGGSVFIKRATWDYYGGFDPELKWMSDVFLYHIVALRYGCVYLPHKITTLSPYGYCSNKDPVQNENIVEEATRLLNSAEYSDVREQCLSIYAWRRWLGIEI